MSNTHQQQQRRRAGFAAFGLGTARNDGGTGTPGGVAARRRAALAAAAAPVFEQLERRQLMSTVLYRVNAGGAPLTTTTPNWTGDTGAAPSIYSNVAAAGSKASSTSTAIDLSHASVPAGTPGALFQSHRWDGGGTPMEWDFPVAPGQYTVNLYFAEVGGNQQSAGARLFDVSIEGAQALDNYDVFADAGGGFKGVVKSFTVVSDGNLDVDFAGVKQNPMVSGIEIVSASTPNQLKASVTTIDFGGVRSGTSATQVLTLTNLGAAGDPSITINSTSIAGGDASQFSDSFNDASPIVLAPGESTNVNVQFNPTSLGDKSGTLSVQHTGTNAPLQVALEGESLPTTAGQLGVSPTSLIFGDVVTGQTKQLTVTLTNLGIEGDPNIVVDSTSITGAGAAAFSDAFDDAGSVTLAPGESTQITVTFAPTEIDAKTATLSIEHSGVNTPLALSLSGNGVAVPPTNAAPQLDAGADQTITLPNTASLSGSVTDDGLPVGETLTTTWVKFSGPGTVTFGDASALATTATFSTSGTYVLRLVADDGSLEAHDAVTINVNPATSGVASYHVNAGGPALSGTPGWTIDTSTTPSPYTNEAAAKSRTGTTSATIDLTHPSLPAGTPMALFQSQRYDGGGVPMEWDFPVANGVYTVRLYFAETSNSQKVVGGRVFDVDIEGNLALDNYDVFAEVGGNTGVAKNFNVNVADGNLDIDFAAVVQNPMVQGIEVIPASVPNQLDASPSSLIYGDVTVGQNGQRTITLTNQGSTGDPAITLNSTSITGDDAAMFSDDFNDGSPLVLQPGQSTTITVTFAPTGAGAKTASLAIVHSGANSPLNVALSGVGVAAASNQPPTANAGGDQTVTLPNTASLSGSATDDGLPAGSTLTTTWSKFSGPGDVTFGDAGNLNTSATFSAAGTYVLRLTASDGTLTTTDDVTITVNPASPANQAPAANAGADQTVTLPNTASLSGSASDDGLPAGSALTTTWSKFSGPGDVTFGNASALSTTAGFSQAGTYVLRLTASDGTLTTTDDVTITVNSATGNAAPVVNAGADLSVTLPGQAALAGSVSDDGNPAGGTLTRAWSVVSGPGTVSFANAASATTNAAFSQAGTYVLRLTGSDGALTSTDDVTVTVNAPTTSPSIVRLVLINADTDQPIAGYEALPNGVVLNLATLPTRNLNIQAITSPATTGSVRFGYDNNANFRTESGAPYALAGDSNGNYSAWTPTLGNHTVTATPFTSSGAKGTAGTPLAVSFTVIDQATPNQPPTVNAGGDQTITLPASANLAGSVTDDGNPVGGTATRTWSKTSGPGTVTFGNANALNTTASFSVAGTYVLRLTASDGALGAFDEVTVTVNPASASNQPPTANAGGDQTVTLPNTASLSGSATDDGLPAGSTLTTTWSKFSGPGDVTFGNAGNLNTSATFSAAGTYVLRLTASDGTLTTTDDVTITVNPASPANQAPAANAGADQTVTLPNTASLSGSASDDGLPAGSALTTTWSKFSGPGDVTFGNANNLSTTAGFSQAGTYVLRLTASDGTLTTTDDVQVIVNPAATGGVLYRVNAGGPAVNGTPGWDVDTSDSPSPLSNFAASGSRTATTSATIDLTHASIPTGTPMSVFQTQRWDGGGTQMEWDFAVANGLYTVRLYFAETSNAQKAVGARVFDVGIEGAVVLDNYDVFAEVGGNKGVVKSINVNVADGNLDLDFVKVVQNPMVQAIEIVPAGIPNQLGISPPNLVYGDVVVGQNGQRTITLTNQGGPGDPSITINSTGISGTHEGMFSDNFTDGTPVVLAPGQSTTITVTFAPTSEGTKTATLSIGHTGTNAPLLVSLSGVGAPAASNQAPTANAGADQTVTLPNTASLSGSASDDGLPAGSTLTTTWSKFSGPGDVTFGNANNLSTTAGFSQAGTYVLRLTASDGTLTTTDDVTITVNPAASNQAPTVNAGTDQSITLPSGAGLSGTASDDGLPAGSSLTTTWSKFSGPGDVTFGDVNAPGTIANFSVPGTYVLRLTATDGTLSSTDDVQVVVNAASAATVVHRVNAGGPVVSGTPDWSGDTSGTPSPFTNVAASGSRTSTTSAVIDLTHPSVPAGTPMSVFQTQRWDGGGVPMEWDFPVEAGQYTVSLYFAEVSNGQKAVGARVFDVSIEGAVVLDNYDVFADVGGNKGVVKTFTVMSDANLDVDFAAVVQNPMFQGIEIVRTGTGSISVLGSTPSTLVHGDVQVGQSNQRTVTLTNQNAPGGANIVIDATSITGADAVMFSDGFNDAGSVTLAPGQSTTITVTFAPTSTGAKSATLEVAHTGSGSPLLVSLTGNGTNTAPTNQPPTVSAGNDQTVTLPSSASLSGSVSDDGLPAGGQLTTTWTKVSGPGTVTFADASFVSTSATFSAAGTYVLRLTASDGSLTTFDEVSVTASSGSGSPVGFGKSTLSGVDTTFGNPTSLQWGPDGRLYVTESKGLIRIYTVARTGPNNYTVTNKETITTISETPNHDDQGNVQTNIKNRLTLGIAVAGTVTNPIIFVSHSDPRITGGGTVGDLDLDTNSGIITRLKWNGASWDRLDLVRGLPRSEENHATNDLVYDRVNNALFVGQGGHTNMGAPSHDLAFLPEYALSAAILRIDLNAIGETTYDLPTLDDLSRPNSSGRTDINDPWGGNDGHNQAVIVEDGPVQVYSPGYRNPYDVVLTQNGRLYTVDNGSNAGWGGEPLDSDGDPTTPATAGDATNDVSEPGVTYQDQLHYIPSQGFYAGHPSPTRANRSNTFNGVYPIGGSTSQSPVPDANPVEGAYRVPGVDDGALTLFSDSTNGLAEYTASNFGGAMNGDLLTVSFDNKLYRMKLSPDGTSVVSKTVLINTVGTVPLDVTTQGQLGLHPGTIWVADYAGDAIVVFEPNDYDGNPGGGTGADDPTLDEDFDGYNNADEIDNGTNPLSSGDVPPDWDEDFTSDLNDPNDDNDSLLDKDDPFAIDPLNGRGNNLPVSYQWENEGTPAGGFLNLGWTGHMINGSANYLDQFDPTKMTAGGAAGVMTIDQIAEGTALGSSNDQLYALQFGVNVTPTSGVVYAHTRLLAPFAGLTPQPGQEMGLFFGNGDQDNYVKLVISGDGGGSVKFVKEVNGVVTTVGTVAQNLGDVDALDLYIFINPATNQAYGLFTTTNEQFVVSAPTTVGPTTSIPSAWITSATAPAVGVMSTSNGPAPTFSGTWDMMEVIPVMPNTLTASASVLSYGPGIVGQPSTQQLTLRNAGGPGDPDIVIDGTTLSGTGALAFADSFDDNGTITLAPGEEVTLDVVFDPATVGAKSATLNINHSGAGSPLAVNLTGVGVVPGVFGEYFNNTDLTGPAGTQVDPNIDFVEADWGSAPPGTGVTADDKYSERFTGYVKIDTAGTWTFYTLSNDGVRLWVNDVQLVDNWTNHGNTENSGSIVLQPGYYPIRLEHYNDTGSVNNQLSFSGPGRSKVIIPTSHLVTDGTPASNNNRLGVSVTTAVFGNVFIGQEPTRTITLTNLGGAGAPSIIVDATTITGAAAGDYSDSFNDAGSVTLAPGESMTVTVTFDPSATGTRTATLQIVHSGSNSPASVSLTGTGVDSSNGFWDDGATMPFKLGETGAAVVGGKIYVIGDGAPNTLAYDIASDTWVSNLDQRDFVAKDQVVQAFNGKLYVFGGVHNPGGGKVASDRLQIYDPVADQWSDGPDMPFGTFAPATAVIGGWIYVAGGVGNVSGGGIFTTDQVARFNPATNAWQSLAPMPFGRDSAAAGTDGSKLYVFGGRVGGDSASNGFDTVQVYDPSTNTWTTSDSPTGPAELPQARGGMTLAPFYDGEFYVIGGETVDGAGATDDHVYDRVDIYNPVTRTWRLGVPMPTARHGFSAVISDSRIFVPGGGTHSGKSQSNLLEILQLPLS